MNEFSSLFFGDTLSPTALLCCFQTINTVQPHWGNKSVLLCLGKLGATMKFKSLAKAWQKGAEEVTTYFVKSTDMTRST